MKKTIIFIFTIILFSNPILAIKKKDSLNQGKALLDSKDIFNAGTWDLYIDKCAAKFHKQFREDLAALSWEDYINYSKGKAKYDNNYSAGNCSKKDTENIVDWFNWIINELERQTTGSRNNTKTIEQIKPVEEEDAIESKLKKLKKLFDQNLITEDEYAEKRQSILDNY